jgi:hypothetical protein
MRETRLQKRISDGPQPCKCGCGRKVPVELDPGKKSIKYFSTACYPSNKPRTKKKRTMWLKVCACPCNMIFADGSGRRVYHTPGRCRERMIADENMALLQAPGAGVYDNVTSKPFNQKICCGGRKFRGACEDFIECSKKEEAGGKWLFEENGGENCYKIQKRFANVFN